MTDNPSLDALLARLVPGPGIPGTGLPDDGDSAADDWLLGLAEAAPEIAPPDALLGRIDAALDSASDGITTQRADEGAWRKAGHGIWIKTLSKGRGGARMFLLRCEAGAVIPGHQHDHDEHVFVLEGAFEMNDLTVRAGDSQFSPGGTLHPDLHSPAGCLLLLYG